MRSLILATLGYILTWNAFSQEAAYKDFSSPYGITLKLPNEWSLDSEALIEKKVELVKLLGRLNQDGKVRILNAGPAPDQNQGYARVRLSITSNAQLSQEDVKSLTPAEIAVLRDGYRKELAGAPLLKVDLNSVEVTKTRANDVYWSYRVSYVRTGINGKVKVEQYIIPFSNRCVLLTLSHEISKKNALEPKLLRVWSSLKINDDILWPKTK